MAFDFPPNPEDGERYLPSDVARDVGMRRHVPPDVSYLDDLVQQQLAALGFQVAPAPQLPPRDPTSAWTPEGFAPDARFGPAGTGFAYGGCPGPAPPAYPGGGQERRGAGSKPVYQFVPKGSVQGKECGPRRAWAEKAQLGGGPNRGVPVQGGSVGRCSGTGVFLPRFNGGGAMRTAVVNVGELTKKAAGRKQYRSLQHPSDMGLPQEWSY